jgi:hypothetical protein
MFKIMVSGFVPAHKYFGSNFFWSSLEVESMDLIL